jgi:hypothetical protein
VSLGAHAELLEEPRHARIGLEVEPREEDAVPGEEIADAERVARVARADHAQAGEAP